MSTTMKILIGVIVVVLVVIGGCGMIIKKASEKITEGMMERVTNGEADVDITGDGTIKVTTDKGTFETGNSVPADWPKDVAVYRGASVQYSASSTDEGAALILDTEDSVADVVAYYKAEMAKSDWKIESTMEGGGTMILMGTKDDRSFSVAISSGSQGHTSITLGIVTETN